LEGSVETLSVREVGNVHIILWQFIQDIANQLLSESFEFCRRYDKNIWLTISWTRCSCTLVSCTF